MARESRNPLALVLEFMRVRSRAHALVRALLVLLAAALVPTALKAGDNTWTSIGPFAAGGDVRTIAVDTVSPGTVYVGTDGGVFKSIDGGTSWGAVNAGITAFTVYAIVIDPTASGTLYAGTNAGIFKTINGGSSWTSNQTGLGLATVQSIALDPTSPNVVYAGTMGSGVSKSVDGGVTWTGSSNGLRNFDVRALAIDPSSSSNLYAGTGQGVFKSTDGAASWSATPGVQTGVRILAIDQATQLSCLFKEQQQLDFRGLQIVRVVQDAADGQLHHAGGLSVEQNVVGVIARHQAAVIEDAGGGHLLHGPLAQGPRRGAEAHRLFAHHFGHQLDRLVQQLLLADLVVKLDQVPLDSMAGIISGLSAALTAGMKKDAGTFWRSRRRRMRGRPSKAAYWPVVMGSEPGVPRKSGTVELSMSKLSATATRAPLGHFLGRKRLPTYMC